MASSAAATKTRMTRIASGLRVKGERTAQEDNADSGNSVTFLLVREVCSGDPPGGRSDGRCEETWSARTARAGNAGARLHAAQHPRPDRVAARTARPPGHSRVLSARLSPRHPRPSAP